MTLLLMGSVICRWIVFNWREKMSKFNNLIAKVSEWVFYIAASATALFVIVFLIVTFIKYPICETATTLNGKRELVYIGVSVIKIGPDNIYHYDSKGRYTNQEARGYIYYDKNEHSIIYRDGDYYAGFKLEGE